MTEKLYYNIGEVSKKLGIDIHTIYYWEKKFTVLSPKRTEKGTRKFSREDITTLKTIQYLLHTKGLSIEAASKQFASVNSQEQQKTETINTLKELKNTLQNTLKHLS